jgi:hypothetical protein
MSDLPKRKVALVVGIQRDDSNPTDQRSIPDVLKAWTTKLRAADFKLVECPLNPSAFQLDECIQQLEDATTVDTLAIFVYAGFAYSVQGSPSLSCKDYVGREEHRAMPDTEKLRWAGWGLLGVARAMARSRYSIIILDACNTTGRGDSSVSSNSWNLLNDVHGMLNEPRHAGDPPFKGVIGLTWTAGWYAVARAEHGVHADRVLQVGICMKPTLKHALCTCWQPILGIQIDTWCCDGCFYMCLYTQKCHMGDHKPGLTHVWAEPISIVCCQAAAAVFTPCNPSLSSIFIWCVVSGTTLALAPI